MASTKTSISKGIQIFDPVTGVVTDIEVDVAGEQNIGNIAVDTPIVIDDGNYIKAFTANDSSLVLPDTALLGNRRLIITNRSNTLPLKVKAFGGDPQFFTGIPRNGSVLCIPDSGNSWMFLPIGSYDGFLTLSAEEVIATELLSVDTDLQMNGETANTVPYLNASKSLVSSAVTPTELGYLSGVTSGIQAQINALGGGGGGSLNLEESASSGSFTAVTPTNVDVTNLTITITTTGGPVKLWLQSASTTTSVVSVSETGVAGNIGMSLDFCRAGVSIAKQNLFGGEFVTHRTIGAPPSSFSHTDTGLAAGTYTYKVQVSSTVGTVSVTNVKLLAKEEL